MGLSCPLLSIPIVVSTLEQGFKVSAVVRAYGTANRGPHGNPRAVGKFLWLTEFGTEISAHAVDRRTRVD
jgi:hypothetical protein